MLKHPSLEQCCLHRLLWHQKTYSKLTWLIPKPEACIHYHSLCQIHVFAVVCFFSFGFPADIDNICKKHGKFFPSRGCCLSAFLSSNKSNFLDLSSEEQNSTNSRVLSHTTHFCYSDRQSIRAHLRSCHRAALQETLVLAECTLEAV